MHLHDINGIRHELRFIHPDYLKELTPENQQKLLEYYRYIQQHPLQASEIASSSFLDLLVLQQKYGVLLRKHEFLLRMAQSIEWHKNRLAEQLAHIAHIASRR